MSGLEDLNLPGHVEADLEAALRESDSNRIHKLERLVNKYEELIEQAMRSATPINTLREGIERLRTEAKC